jgi:hypothetical protein
MLPCDAPEQHVVMVTPDRPNVASSLLHADDGIQHTFAVRPAINVITQQVDTVILPGIDLPYQRQEGLQSAVYVTDCVAVHGLLLCSLVFLSPPIQYNPPQTASRVAVFLKANIKLPAVFKIRSQQRTLSVKQLIAQFYNQ